MPIKIKISFRIFIIFRQSVKRAASRDRGVSRDRGESAEASGTTSDQPSNKRSRSASRGKENVPTQIKEFFGRKSRRDDHDNVKKQKVEKKEGEEDVEVREEGGAEASGTEESTARSGSTGATSKKTPLGVNSHIFTLYIYILLYLS